MNLSLTCKSLLLLVVLGCVGCSASPEPQEQALRFLNALKTRDFGVWYDTAEVDMEKYPTRQAFLDHITLDLDPKKMTDAFAEIEFAAGMPKIEEDTAVVPITTTGRVMGQRQQQAGELKLKRIQGVWRVAKENLTSGADILSGGKK